MDLKIKKLNKKDIDLFIELICVFEDVFEMESLVVPEKAYLENLLSRSDFIVFVAIKENKVVGGLTSYVLRQYYSKKPLVYIYDLAIETRFQRKGIGTHLISSLNNYSKEKGFEEVFVQANKVDEYAIDFYRSTGAREEEVVHFYYALDKWF